MIDPLLDSHKKLLKIVAKGEATKDVADGWDRSEWINLTHGNIITEMKSKGGWPPLVKLAALLHEYGLVELKEDGAGRKVKLTDAGRALLNEGEVKVRHQGAASLDIQILHAEVQRIAKRLVEDGHYRQAITDTFIGLDKYVQNKCGLSETGTPLMQKAFSANGPILELSKDKEEQTGFMMLFTGAIKAIRNQYAHNLVDPKNKEEALEWLGFASALFRLTDVSTKLP